MKKVLLVFFVSAMAHGQSYEVSTTAGQSHDNQQSKRTRFGVATSTIYSDTRSDWYLIRDFVGGQNEDTGNIALSKKFESLSEVRGSVTMTSNVNAGTKSTAGSIGFGQWVFAEQTRVSVDYTRSHAIRSAKQYIDFDAQIVALPADVDSDSVALGVRQLVNPSLIVDAGLTAIKPTDRPTAIIGTLAGRQYISVLHGAVSSQLGRGMNVGSVKPVTSYGEVDAWVASVQWTQELPGSVSVLLGYRYYQEHERTRALNQDLIFGSDSIVTGLTKDWSDWTAAATYTRYQANSGLSAGTVEAKLTKRF